MSKKCTYCEDDFVSKYDTDVNFRMCVRLAGFENYYIGPDGEDVCDDCTNYIGYESYVCKYCEIEFTKGPELATHMESCTLKN